LSPSAVCCARPRWARASSVGGGAISTLLGTSTALAGTDGVAFVPDDLDLHLLRRATYRATPGLLSQARSMGRNAWLDKQLAPASSTTVVRRPDRRPVPHLRGRSIRQWNKPRRGLEPDDGARAGRHRARRLEQAAALE